MNTPPISIDVYMVIEAPQWRNKGFTIKVDGASELPQVIAAIQQAAGMCAQTILAEFTTKGETQ